MPAYEVDIPGPVSPAETQALNDVSVGSGCPTDLARLSQECGARIVTVPCGPVQVGPTVAQPPALAPYTADLAASERQLLADAGSDWKVCKQAK